MKIWISVVCCIAASGCYASRRVAPQALASAGTRLTGNVALPALDGGVVTLAPSTKLRVHERDGAVSDWHDGGDLALLADGVASSDVRRLDEAREAFVADLSPAQSERLRALAPPGALLEAGGGQRTIVTAMMDEADAAAYVSKLRNPRWLHLSAPDPGALVAWVRCFAREAPASPWVLLGERHRPLGGALSGAALADAAPAERRVFVTNGARWADVSYVELRQLEPLPTLAAAVPVVPLLVLGALAVSSAGGDVHATANDSETPGEGTDRALAISSSCAGDCAPPASPLFDDRARRRGYVMGLAAAEAAAELHQLRAGAALGLRLYDIYEMAFVFHDLETETDGAWSRRSALGLSLGVHAPLADSSRWALAFSLAAGATLPSPSLFWLDARLGPRRALGRTLFVGLPVLASFQEAAPHTGRGAWGVGLGIELGVAY
jgi:hypothetical protein